MLGFPLQPAPPETADRCRGPHGPAPLAAYVVVVSYGIGRQPSVFGGNGPVTLGGGCAAGFPFGFRQPPVSAGNGPVAVFPLPCGLVGIGGSGL